MLELHCNVILFSNCGEKVMKSREKEKKLWDKSVPIIEAVLAKFKK